MEASGLSQRKRDHWWGTSELSLQFIRHFPPLSAVAMVTNSLRRVTAAAGSLLAGIWQLYASSESNRRAVKLLAGLGSGLFNHEQANFTT